MTTRTVKVQYLEDGVEVGHSESVVADFPGVFTAIEGMISALTLSHMHGMSEGKRRAEIFDRQGRA